MHLRDACLFYEQLNQVPSKTLTRCLLRSLRQQLGNQGGA